MAIYKQQTKYVPRTYEELLRVPLAEANTDVTNYALANELAGLKVNANTLEDQQALDEYIKTNVSSKAESIADRILKGERVDDATISELNNLSQKYSSTVDLLKNYQEKHGSIIDSISTGLQESKWDNDKNQKEKEKIKSQNIFNVETGTLNEVKGFYQPTYIDINSEISNLNNLAGMVGKGGKEYSTQFYTKADINDAKTPSEVKKLLENAKDDAFVTYKQGESAKTLSNEEGLNAAKKELLSRYHDNPELKKSAEYEYGDNAEEIYKSKIDNYFNIQKKSDRTESGVSTLGIQGGASSDNNGSTVSEAMQVTVNKPGGNPISVNSEEAEKVNVGKSIDKELKKIADTFGNVEKIKKLEYNIESAKIFMDSPLPGTGAASLMTGSSLNAIYQLQLSALKKNESTIGRIYGGILKAIKEDSSFKTLSEKEKQEQTLSIIGNHLKDNFVTTSNKYNPMTGDASSDDVREAFAGSTMLNPKGNRINDNDLGSEEIKNSVLYLNFMTGQVEGSYNGKTTYHINFDAVEDNSVKALLKNGESIMKIRTSLEAIEPIKLQNPGLMDGFTEIRRKPGESYNKDERAFNVQIKRDNTWYNLTKENEDILLQNITKAAGSKSAAYNQTIKFK